jgi:ArsR family transcriptional regulator
MKLIAEIECCAPLVGSDLDAAEAERLAAALRVVADPARLRLLNLIAATDEVCVCDLAEPLGLTQPTVSHHLKVLTEAGFLEREKRGRWVYHRLVRERLDDVAGALVGRQATGSP